MVSDRTVQRAVQRTVQRTVWRTVFHRIDLKKARCVNGSRQQRFEEDRVHRRVSKKIQFWMFALSGGLQQLR
jgi:hypothetical protein